MRHRVVDGYGESVRKKWGGGLWINVTGNSDCCTHTPNVSNRQVMDKEARNSKGEGRS